MRYSDVDFNNIISKLELQTRAVLFDAMIVFKEIEAKLHNNELNHNELTIMSLYLSLLRVATKFREGIRKNSHTCKLSDNLFFNVLNISDINNNYLDEETYRKLYSEYFQDIIYNSLFVSKLDNSNVNLETFKIEHLAYHIHNDYAIGGFILKKLFDKYFPKKDYFQHSLEISYGLLENLYAELNDFKIIPVVIDDSQRIVVFLNYEEEQNKKTSDSKILKFEPRKK